MRVERVIRNLKEIVGKQMQDLTFTRYDEEDMGDINTKYASIIKFKTSLEKIELLIGLSETPDEKAELQEMKDNILEALEEETTQLKEQEKKRKLFSLSMETLKEEDVGKLAKCYMEEEKKWKNSEVLNVDTEEQTATVFQYGKNEKVEFPAYKLKVLKTPDPTCFHEGVFCKSIYSVDGEFYPCVIEKVEGGNYHVKYRKYNSKEAVKLHRLREMKNNEEQKDKEYKFENLSQLKIPEHLKILPNDPENVKKSKKTKVKAMKFAFKSAQIDEVNKEKQSKWQNFNNSGISFGHFKMKQEQEAFQKPKEQRTETSKPAPPTKTPQ